MVEPYPSEKYESQLGWSFPIYGRIKHVLNHQPAISTLSSLYYGYNSISFIDLYGLIVVLPSGFTQEQTADLPYSYVNVYQRVQ